MAPHISFVISGLLLVIITIVIQAFPIKKTDQIVQLPSKNNQQLLTSVDSETSSPIIVSQSLLSMLKNSKEKNDNKKKLYIDNDELDEYLDNENDELPYFKFKNNNNEIDHTLHAKIKETSAKIHDNQDKPVNTDDSKKKFFLILKNDSK